MPPNTEKPVDAAALNEAALNARSAGPQDIAKPESESVDKDAVINIADSASKEGNDDGNDSKKEKEKAESFSMGPFLRVFKYSTALDHVLRLIGTIAACGAGAALPLMTVVFGDMVNDFNSWGAGISSGSDLYSSISQNALYFLYLFIGKFVLVWCHTTCFTMTGIRATRRLRQDFIKSLIRQDIAYFDTCAPGTVATTISSNADMVENGIGEKVGVAVTAIAMLLAAFIVAFTQQWKLTLVTAVCLPVTVFVVGLTVFLDAKLESKVLKVYGTAGGLVEEAMGTIRIVTAFNAKQKLRKKYDVYLDEAKGYGVRKGPVLGVQYSTEFFTMYCAYALAWFYGVRLLVRGEVDSGGQVITVLFAVLIATSSMTMIAPSIGEFSKAAAAAKGMFDMIDRQSKIDPLQDGGLTPESTSGKISFQNVSFAYPSRPTIKVLEDVNLQFEAGKVTALVGASGSGKSTIVGLIERWFDPEDGFIQLDDNETRSLNVKWLRSQIGLVQQEPVLFNDTIYNNVAHGLYGTEMDKLPESEKRELVKQACIQAYADDFIQDLPEKYDTKVGDRGGMLSGGQKQRVAIARSVISNPRILLLDEATSALDPTAEGKVQAALDNVSKTRTTIMIAHKLSTVRKADKIVVLSKGKVIEEGNHEELLAKENAYYNLVNAQTLHAQETAETHSINDESSEENAADEELVLKKTVTSASKASIQTARSELKQNDVSRKFSLARCILIVFKEQKHLWPFFAAGFLSTIGAGGVFPAQAVVFAKSVLVFQLPTGPYMENRGNFWALMFFVLGLGVLICYASIGLFFTVAAFHATRYYRSEYFDAMLRQDISFFDIEGNSAGEMTSRLSTDPQRLQDLISANFGLILIVLVNLIGSCILALAVGWQLALVAIFGCIPALFFAGFMRMRLEIQSQDQTSKMYHESARFAAEAIGAIRTVSSLTLEQKVLDAYGARLESTAKKNFQRKAFSMILFGLSESLDLAAAGLAFWYGGKLLSEGKYDVETFFIIFIAIIFGGQAAGFLFGFTLNTTKAHAAANHIIDLRRSKPFINTSTGITELSNDQDVAIEFKKTRFAYPTRPNQQVLRGLNLKIKKGESVGIVGSSGCGKTTVISLLERFYDIDGGSLLIHGTSLRELDVHQHRARIGLVSQDTTLYQGSIRENVLLGLSEDSEKEGVSDEQVINACKAANIHDFIVSLPSGYDTDAGTRGLSLSGGQRQRLAIARALIRNPEILLFDEATSALDTANEVVVQKAIEAAAKGRTTISVAHRLSTIKRCDRIFVLHEGKVVEEGTHTELIGKKGRYYEMVLTQSLDREVE